MTATKQTSRMRPKDLPAPLRCLHDPACTYQAIISPERFLKVRSLAAFTNPHSSAEQKYRFEIALARMQEITPEPSPYDPLPENDYFRDNTKTSGHHVNDYLGRFGASMVSALLLARRNGCSAAIYSLRDEAMNMRVAISEHVMETLDLADNTPAIREIVTYSRENKSDTQEIFDLAVFLASQ